MKKWRLKEISWPLLAGLVVGLASLILTVHLVSAAPPQQTEEGSGEIQDAQNCQECHLDISNHWQESPHANAFDDEVFRKDG
jgi:hypothetical protein